MCIRQTYDDADATLSTYISALFCDKGGKRGKTWRLEIR